MALKIKVSDTSYQEKLITLNRERLYITFSYNTRDERWYFDLAKRDGTDVLCGVKILSPQNLTGKYIGTHEIIEGDVFCVSTKVGGEDINRDNFGTDKQYQFIYISEAEQEEIVNESTV